MNRITEFDVLLSKRRAPPTRKQVTLERVDGFLKEALRIVSSATLDLKALTDIVTRTPTSSSYINTFEAYVAHT